MKAQMATLEGKTRELEARLQETKDFTVRLSRLVVKLWRVICSNLKNFLS